MLTFSASRLSSGRHFLSPLSWKVVQENELILFSTEHLLSHCLYSFSIFCLFFFFSFLRDCHFLSRIQETDDHYSSIIVPSYSLNCLLKYYNHRKLSFTFNKCNYIVQKCIKAKINPLFKFILNIAFP